MNIDDKLVTFITVVKNDVNNIEDTILSIISQKKLNIEYIIIDGGSKDGTCEVINRYISKIDKFISEPDGGIYDAMNKGVKLSTGKYINFINSGDVHMPDFLQYVLYDNLDGDYDYYHSNLLLKINSNIENISKPMLNIEKTKRHMGNPLLHPTLIVSKKIFNKIGYFNTKFKISADHEWVLRMINNNYLGLHVDCALTIFLLGGISDNLEATKESKRILIANGLNRIEANFIYIRYIIILKIKRLINKYINEK